MAGSASEREGGSGIVHARKLVVGPQQTVNNVFLSFSDGRIQSVTKHRPEGDIESFDVILPGFVDLHNHGVGGAGDVVQYWTAPEYTLSRIVRRGTTSTLATVMFPPSDTGEPDWRAADAAHAAVGRTDLGCVIEGLHCEGPLLASLGAAPDQGADMPLAAFCALLDRYPATRVMTIAPSADAATGFARLRAAVARNVVPALGHDKDATAEDIQGALRACGDACRAHATHCFNVMSFHHRAPSLTNFCLARTLPRLPEFAGCRPPTVEVIVDGAHVHPLAVRNLIDARGTEDVCCVTDAIAEPVPGARHAYNGRYLYVCPAASKVTLEGTDTLAGSCCDLLASFQTLVHIQGLSLQDASAMCSANPARIAGLTDVGTLDVGKRASFVCLDEALCAVKAVFVAGRRVVD